MKKLIYSALLLCAFVCSNLFSQSYDFEDKLVPIDFLMSNDRMAQHDGVSIDGNYAVVGVNDSDITGADSGGLSFLFKWNDTLCQWHLIDTITPQIAINVLDADPSAEFGRSVSIKDSIIVIGAPGYYIWPDMGGRAYVYKIIDEEAVFVQRLQAWHNDGTDDDEMSAMFSIDLDWDGNNLIVGARNEDQSEPWDPSYATSGAAYIFNWNGSSFDFITKIYAPVRNTNDWFGASVGISGDFAVVGAEGEDEDALETDTKLTAGSAYVYKYNSGTNEWDFFQKLVAPASDRSETDLFGSAVDISQLEIVVGARGEDFDEFGLDSISVAGAAYIYNYTTAFNFTQKIVASDRAYNDQYGDEVKIYNNTILVGVGLKDIGILSDAGKAYVYLKDGTYSESQTFTAGVPAEDAQFGEAIEMDYKRLIIGEPYNELNENDETTTMTGIGAAHIYDIEFHPQFNTIQTNQVGYCSEQAITFKVYGNLYDAYGWEWYEDSCEGTYLGEGDSITLELEDTTRICVRAVDCFEYIASEDCHCIDVYINDDYWHQKTDYGLDEIPSDVITDAEGNIYTTGKYLGFAQFNGGDNTAVLADDLEPGVTYASKIFVSKHDNCGNLLWVAYSIGDEMNEFSNGITLKESEDVLYIVGEFTDEITIMNGQGDEGIGAGSYTLTEAAGTKGGFVAQINREDGEVNFIELVASSLSKDRLTAVCINENNGDLYVGGQTYDTPGQEKVFVRKYQPSFTGLSTHHWEEISAHETGAIINGMDYDGTSPSIDDMGSLWFTGTFRDNFRFDLSDPLLTSGAAVTDAFVGKFEEYDGGISDDYVTRDFVKGGNILSSLLYKMEGNDIDTDPATGNAYITGNKIGEISNAFGMSGEDLPFEYGNHLGYFVAIQYDGGIPTGSLSDVTYPFSETYATGDGVVVKNDKVYFTGSRRLDVRFQPGELWLPYTGTGASHLYIVAYNLSDGDFSWANGTLNPDEIGASTHLPKAIAANNEGHAYIVGEFWNEMGYIDGSPSSGDLTYTSNGGSLFIMRVDIEGDGEEALEFTLPDEIKAEQGDFDSISFEDNQINDFPFSNAIKIYPNPTTGNSTLFVDQSVQETLKLFVYSVDGKLLLQKSVRAGNTEIDISNFAPGIYMVKVQGIEFNEQLNLIKKD